jgi:hypothetical protein
LITGSNKAGLEESGANLTSGMTIAAALLLFGTEALIS